MMKLTITSLPRYFYKLICLAVLGLTATLGHAQSPTLKVDFDFGGRKLGEVNEPGYTSWVVEEGSKAEATFSNVAFTVSGDGLHSSWYKAGIQAPFYARLSNDGVVANEEITLTIEGLPAGKHSLMNFYNTFDNPENNTFSPIDIYVNDELQIDDLMPSNRAESRAVTETGYLIFEVAAGEAVTIRMVNDPKNESNAAALVWNGFELNRPDIKKQAKSPLPEDGDEHVEADSGVTLKWEPAKTGVKHQVYFGTSKAAVAEATSQDDAYRGELTANHYQVNDLYSMDTYYWRVDEVDQNGEITKGNVWYFRPAQLAFRGAEGYGRYARGGRGGKVVTVTNLNDSGPGSLREAVTNDIGPRTIVFAVGGTIELKSRLVSNQRYVTIAGQTAPGKGIMIERAPVGITGDDGVARFLRVGIGAGRTFDGMGLTGANYSIIDHCSIRWTIDESFSSRGAHHITLQKTLIAEALNVADHSKYEQGKMHGYAATIGGDIGSFHHNLLAHNYGRNWSMGSGLDGNAYYKGKLDIRNNVVYNWGGRTTDGGSHEVNFVNNYYKPGPGTEHFIALTIDHEGVGLGTQRGYFSGNVMPGYFDEDNQEEGRRERYHNGDYKKYEGFVDEPFFPAHITTQPAREAYKIVLSDVGANQPVLDDHDQRIIQETLDSTYTYKGSLSGIPGMPDTEQDVGGWEDYPEVKRPENWDTDQDGLPDWWEEAKGLNPNSKPDDFSDANKDEDRDGFTQLDEYLDWMSRPHYFIEKGDALNLDLKPLFKGFEDGLRFSLEGQSTGKSFSVQKDHLTFTAEEAGLAAVKVKVEDMEDHTMTRWVNVFVKDH
ncbi:T9SS C-terminal target domain-containing protein [Echinicola strongylocentroti]|uniref:T9SS C-terminal target domain-containing protein n=2 Tax=Echinicola strongylocentroti TaxID=1795355 RepID=A0A2Z4IRV6_9BACT|nr:T9SS C-terminal target domain-containing protein [Echinicola strongylocentroti]